MRLVFFSSIIILGLGLGISLANPSPWQLYIFEEVNFQILLPAKPELWQIGYHNVKAQNEDFMCQVASFAMVNENQAAQIATQTSQTIAYMQNLMGVKLKQQRDFKQGKYQVRELVLAPEMPQNHHYQALIVRMIATPKRIYQVSIAYRKNDSAKIQAFFKSFRFLE